MFGFDYFVPFDLRTLFRLIFITDLVVCAMLLAYREQGKEQRLVQRFILARSLHATGCLLIGLRGIVPGWLSIDIANPLVYFGFALELSTVVGMRMKNGVFTPLFLTTAVVGVFAILTVGTTPGRLVGISSLTVVALFAPAAVVRDASRLQRVTVAVYAAMVLAFLERAYSGFMEGYSTLDRELAQFLGLIVMYAYAVAGGIGFLLLMKEDDDRRLRHAATIDSLTGILNRGAFFAAARTAMETGARAGRPLALLMVDVDHFKRINDTYGHPAGDKVLQALVRVIAGGIRPADVFGRLGGEEFAVLLPDAASGDAVVVAERIRLSVHGLIVPDMPQISCSISIGCAVLRPRGGEDLDPLMQRCDAALYDAKHNGRDCVIVAGDAAAVPRDAVEV